MQQYPPRLQRYSPLYQGIIDPFGKIGHYFFRGGPHDFGC